MSKKTRVWLIIAAVLIVAGIIICSASLYLAKGDFSSFSTVEYQTMEYELSEDYLALSINADTADIIFRLSSDGSTKVICRENVKVPHIVKIEDDFLKISVDDQRKLLDYVSVGDFDQGESIEIHLPRDEYNALYINSSTSDVFIPQGLLFYTMDIELSTGDVEIHASTWGDTNISTSTGHITFADNPSAGMLKLRTSTGSISLANMDCYSLDIGVNSGDTNIVNVSCESFEGRSDTGSFSLENLYASAYFTVEPNFTIETGTGDVTLLSCSGSRMEINTDTGDVHVSLPGAMKVFAESDTGDINIPPLPEDPATLIGSCKINTGTGDIFAKFLS